MTASNSSGNGLRLAVAEQIQQYRRTKLLPIYGAAELREIVEAWFPVVEAAGIKPQYLRELFIFALARRNADRIFGAEDLARNWQPFIERKKCAALHDYEEAVEAGVEERVAWAAYVRRCAEMSFE